VTVDARWIRRLLLVGLAMAVLAPLPAMGQEGAPADCGVLAVASSDSPFVVGQGTTESLLWSQVLLPCRGPVTVKAVLELRASLTDVEIRLSAVLGCVESEIGPGGGPGCVVGTTATLAPSSWIIPVPSAVNGQTVGSSTYAVTASGTVDRGAYFGIIRVEAISGDLEVSQYAVHAISGGFWSPLAER
jgi:hypothetical protein